LACGLKNFLRLLLQSTDLSYYLTHRGILSVDAKSRTSLLQEYELFCYFNKIS
jgi:hypothetical protein